MKEITGMMIDMRGINGMSNYITDFPLLTVYSDKNHYRMKEMDCSVAVSYMFVDSMLFIAVSVDSIVAPIRIEKGCGVVPPPDPDYHDRVNNTLCKFSGSSLDAFISIWDLVFDLANTEYEKATSSGQTENYPLKNTKNIDDLLLKVGLPTIKELITLEMVATSARLKGSMHDVMDIIQFF